MLMPKAIRHVPNEQQISTVKYLMFFCISEGRLNMHQDVHGLILLGNTSSISDSLVVAQN